MPRVTAEEYARDWGDGLKASTAKIRRGVERVNVNPMDKAAESLEKMINNFVESIRNGKWLRGIEGISLNDWKRAMTTKGITNIASGVDGAHDKVVRRARVLLDQVGRVQEEVEQMPDATFEERIARMTHAARRMHEINQAESNR